MAVVVRFAELMVNLERSDERRKSNEAQREGGDQEANGMLSLHHPRLGRCLYVYHTGSCRSSLSACLCYSVDPNATLPRPRSYGSRRRIVFIDSHCHLDDARYDTDREAIIARGREAGVGQFVTIGCDLETSRAAVALARKHPFICATVGVHPHEAKRIEDGWYPELRALAGFSRVVAYGEIGLDYHYDHSPRDIQRERFREQIRLARELRLPVVIHTREAQEDTIAILRKEKAQELGGVFHCFSGDAWLAKDALDLGFYLSFSGVITFQNATMLRDIVKTVPLDRILVETDSPYLAPVPYRGKRNEPAYVRLVAEKLAEIHDVDVQKVEETTTENAKRLFRIK